MIPSVTVLAIFLQSLLFLIRKSLGIFTVIFSSISNNLPAHVGVVGCSRQLLSLTLGSAHLFHLKFIIYSFHLKFVPMTTQELSHQQPQLHQCGVSMNFLHCTAASHGEILPRLCSC